MGPLNRNSHPGSHGRLIRAPRYLSLVPALKVPLVSQPSTTYIHHNRCLCFSLLGTFSAGTKINLYLWYHWYLPGTVNFSGPSLVPSASKSTYSCVHTCMYVPVPVQQFIVYSLLESRKYYYLYLYIT